jgi:hypothetical protein
MDEDARALFQCFARSGYPPLLVAMLWRWLVTELRPLARVSSVRCDSYSEIQRLAKLLLLTDPCAVRAVLLHTPWPCPECGFDDRCAWLADWVTRMSTTAAVAEGLGS